jgi:hypothetical protein
MRNGDLETDPQRIQRGDIKSVGKSGQISLGKRYAGKTFCVRQRPDGSLLLTAVAMVPESVLWTLREPDRSAIIKGMTWAASVPPSETDLDDLAAKASRRPTGSKLSRLPSRRSRAPGAK